ncbi:Transcriptional regulator, MarR family [Candidatus Sulfobium mesophilum]|uniref:Transcriptional regulator, MarR family n=1 Tax=Candidatus Sulfobium mesophilum TaxID=2016548 RepID=A0A2U3QEX7_9BACT|nr:Transcriptional regulator, MarR family [Candidatus Sulfobium mesophilum]
MNIKAGRKNTGPMKSLQLLDTLSNEAAITQRDLSQRLGIALGLVNSYIKNLVAKGYVTVKSIPPKRYTYYLTPKGFAEKTRLTYQHLQNYTGLYTSARNDLRKLFNELQSQGTKRVVFAGVDELAEIAFLTLQETNLELAGVVDGERSGDKFFGREITSLDKIREMQYDSIIVSSYLKRAEISAALLKNGVNKDEIRVIFKP